MPRSIWTGTVGFGLVQIPVSLHGAEEKDELDMTMLDRRNFSPVGYRRVNKKTGKEVPWEEIVKGYEHGKGEYIVLSDTDFEKANVEATRRIDILDFVDFTEIDPRYLDRPYYLAPQKAGRKAYALLREILKKSNKVGIGKVVIRTRQHLAAVVARDKVLLLVLLRFSNELRNEGDLDLPETNLGKLGITPKEIQMADRLVASMVEPFEPKKYVDEYRRDLMKLIAKKAKAGEVNRVPEEEEEAKPASERRAKIIDLASLLASSLSPKQPGPAKAGAKRRRAGAESRSQRKSGRETHRKSA